MPELADWLESQFEEVPRPSFSIIEQRLRNNQPLWQKVEEAGRRTGHSSIHRYWLRWAAEAARRRVLQSFTRQFNDDPDAVLDIETAITQMANGRIMEALEAEFEHEGLTPKAAALIELHRKLQTSSARREAERRAAGKTQRTAFQKAREEIVSILKQHPDALELVLTAIDSAQHSTEEP